MKTIFTTIAMTLGVVYLAGALFLNSILGVFGLVAAPIHTYQEMKAAQHVVKKMKKRHATKKSKAGKKLGKKASKRVGASVLAAATIGTLAVATAVTAMEISDYCDEKEELQEDENILNETQVEFDMEQCLDEGKNDAKMISRDVMAASSQAVKNAMAGTVSYSAEKWDAIKQASMDATSSASDYTADLWDSTKSWFED